MKIETICVFGDSTAWGAWDTDRGGWVNRLGLYVGNRERDDYLEIYNMSISGGTTEGILNRFEAEAKARNADALIFQSGGNDSAHHGNPEEHNVPPQKFRANLREIIRRAKAITPHICFVDLKSCDESKTTPVPWENFYYTNKALHEYNEIMREVCEESGVLFLDIFEELGADDFEDGIHPNSQGHQKIFERVKNFLEEHRWI